MRGNHLTRRDFVRLAGLSVAGVTLAACAVPVAAPAASTGSGESAAPAGETVDVRFATDWVEGARGATIETALKRFPELHPEINVILEPIGGDYFDRLQIQFSGGTVADVILFEGVLALEYINEGLIADLAPTLESLNIDQTKWRPGPVDIFLQEGKVYAIPFQLTPAIWVYNKTLFQERGVPEPDDTWDWADALDAAMALTDAPNSYGFWARVDMNHGYGSMGLTNSEVHWVNDDFTHTNFDDPGFADAIRWIIATVQEHGVSPQPAEVEGLLTAGVTNLFVTGKIAMNPVNAGSVGTYTRDVGDRFEWDIMPTPKGPLTGRGGGLWNDQPHVVTSGAIDRNVLAEATDLVLYLAGDEVQENIAKDRGSCPTVAAIQESETYMAPPPNNMHIIVDELKNEVGPKYFPRFLEWFNAVNKEFELGLIGERDADATIEAMVAEGDKILASI
jgi:multiple sugar transport system substrate-binding protein